MVISKPNYSAATTAKAKLLSTSEEVELLREQVEFLNAQVDSLHQMVEQLNSELLDKQQQIQDLEQELARTNRELCHALALPERETGEPQQIELEEPTRVECERTIHVDESENNKIPVKTDTPLRILARQTIKNSKEAIAHSKQLHAQYKELGFQFVGSQAKYRQFQEHMYETVTQAQQYEAEKLIFQHLNQYGRKYQKILQQFNFHQQKCGELIEESKLYVKQIKLELAKLNNSNENFAKVGFCLAETYLQD